MEMPACAGMTKDKMIKQNGTLTTESRPLSPLYWLWIPVVVMILELLGEIFIDHDTFTAIHSEYGPHEMVEFFAISAATILAAYTFLTMDRSANKWLTAWVAIAAVCGFYVSAEEISWGQTFLQWSTPEFWSGINQQSETNLHNTSSWLNQKPRILLEIGVITGGVIIPALRRFKPSWLPQKFEIIYPPSYLFVIAALFTAYRAANFAATHFFDYKLFARPSEVSELYMFYFVLLYIISLRPRLPKKRQA